MATSTASARTWLPIASLATRRAATSGTPAPTSVPSMRQKRTRANRETAWPKTGKRSVACSRTRRPSSLASTRRSPNTARATTITKTNQYCTSRWLAPTMALVNAGSEPPKSANIVENRGMKNVSRNTRTPPASTARIIGYSIADVTLFLRSCSRERNVAICSSTTIDESRRFRRPAPSRRRRARTLAGAGSGHPPGTCRRPPDRARSPRAWRSPASRLRG